MLLRPASFCVGTLFALIVVYFFGPRYSAVTDYVKHFDTNVARTDDPSTNATNVAQPDSGISSITNRTLGVSDEPVLPFGDQLNNSLQFEKVLVVGLPERSDRRDTLTMVAAINDIKLRWVDAVKGSEMERKAWPAVCGSGYTSA